MNQRYDFRFSVLLIYLTFRQSKMDETTESLLENSEDEEAFQKLYSEGLKHSSQNLDDNTPVPKFYSRVRSLFVNSCNIYA